MPKKFISWIKKNPAEAVAVAISIASVGSVASTASKIFELWTSFTMPMLTWTFFCILIGLLAGSSFGFLRKARKQKAKIERLERAFLSMSKRRKALVLTALEEGEVELWPLDPDGQSLLSLGILGSPLCASMAFPTKYSIQPNVIKEIDKHKDEWIGTIDDKELKKLLKQG